MNCKDCDFVLCVYCGCDADGINCPKLEEANDGRVFSTGAKRDSNTGRGRMDLLPWKAILELSKHCERGAAHYGSNNVRLGIPYSSLVDSGARHLANFASGITDEPTHLVAACWNLMWLLEETITRPDLNDMYWAEKPEGKDDNYAAMQFDLKKYEEYLKGSVTNS